MNASRTWTRCVAQRLQWDRRDERSAVLQRAANDDRMRLNTNDDDLSDETSFVPPVAKPYDLLIASDVLTGSPTDDGHLLDTVTEPWARELIAKVGRAIVGGGESAIDVFTQFDTDDSGFLEYVKRILSCLHLYICSAFAFLQNLYSNLL